MAPPHEVESGFIERRYYSAETLNEELRANERKYGVSSELVAAQYRESRDFPEGVPRFEGFVWAQTYRMWQDMRG